MFSTLKKAGDKLVAYFKDGTSLSVMHADLFDINKSTATAPSFTGAAGSGLLSPEMISAGAVVEYGSNSDGRYIKYENGYARIWQYIDRDGASSPTFTGSWTFPITLIKKEAAPVRQRRAANKEFSFHISGSKSRFQNDPEDYTIGANLQMVGSGFNVTSSSTAAEVTTADYTAAYNATFSTGFFVVLNLSIWGTWK